jgi:hypothetical protein
VLRCAAQFRAEAQPLLDAVAAGQFSRADLQQAATLLVARYAPLASAAGADGAAADGAAGGDADEDGMFEAGPAGRSASCTPWPAGGAASSGGSSRARELMGALLQRPLGSALLGHAAAGVSAWSAPETEYGRCVCWRRVSARAARVCLCCCLVLCHHPPASNVNTMHMCMRTPPDPCMHTRTHAPAQQCLPV